MAKEESGSSKLKAESKNKKTVAGKPEPTRPIAPVEDLAKARNVKAWELAGLMRAAGWAEGKQVAETDFNDALERFRTRPQGGGRI